MSELLKRILVAVPAAVIFIGLIWLGGWYFKGMVIVIGFFIIHEMNRLLDGAGTPVDVLFPYTIGLWIMLSPELTFALEIGIAIFLFFAALQTFNTSEYNTTNLVATFFAGLYAPVGLLSLMMVYSITGQNAGFLLTVILVFMVWGADVFAYFGGKAVGKRPLAPAISPNKTWEGFIFGYLGSIVGAALVFYITPIESPVSFVQLLPMALLVATFGPIGDLLESKLKRKAGVKDSSSIFPGHGGFFDRFDALLLASPAALIYLKALELTGNVSF